MSDINFYLIDNSVLLSLDWRFFFFLVSLTGEWTSQYLWEFLLFAAALRPLPFVSFLLLLSYIHHKEDMRFSLYSLWVSGCSRSIWKSKLHCAFHVWQSWIKISLFALAQIFGLKLVVNKIVIIAIVFYQVHSTWSEGKNGHFGPGTLGWMDWISLDQTAA